MKSRPFRPSRCSWPGLVLVLAQGMLVALICSCQSAPTQPPSPASSPASGTGWKGPESGPGRPAGGRRYSAGEGEGEPGAATPGDEVAWLAQENAGAVSNHKEKSAPVGGVEGGGGTPGRVAGGAPGGVPGGGSANAGSNGAVGTDSEAAARRVLDELALRSGFLHWQPRLTMKEGEESPVTIEISPGATSTLGSALPSSVIIETSAVMSAELRGDSHEFAITPQGEVSQVLYRNGASWTWYVTPLSFGRHKKLHVTARMQLDVNGRTVSHDLPDRDIEIDVSVSPLYLAKTHWKVLFGSGGLGGLISLLVKNKRVKTLVGQLGQFFGRGGEGAA
jgi:hypothetical protein